MHHYDARVIADQATGRPLAGIRATLLDAETQTVVQAYRDGVPVTLVSGAHGLIGEFETEETTRRVALTAGPVRLTMWCQEVEGTAADAVDTMGGHLVAAEAAASEAASIRDDLAGLQEAVTEAVAESPADSAVAAAIDRPATLTRAALDARYLRSGSVLFDASLHGVTGDARPRLKPGPETDGSWCHQPTGPLWEGTDVTDRLHDLFDLARESGAATVMLPPGAYLARGLVLPQGIRLVGAGQREDTTIVLADGSNAPVIRGGYGATSGSTAFHAVENLTVDGNAWGQAGYKAGPRPDLVDKADVLTAGHGILLHREAIDPAQAGEIDSWSLVQGVTVRNTRATGIVTRYAGGENRLVNVRAEWCGGWGVVPGHDTMVDLTTAAQNSAGGIDFSSGSMAVGTIKAFGNGSVWRFNRQRSGNRTFIRPAPGVRMVGGMQILGQINAQNNAGHGVICSSSGLVADVLADSNNMLAWKGTSADFQSVAVPFEYATGDEYRAAVPDAPKVTDETYAGVHFTAGANNIQMRVAAKTSGMQGGQPYGWQAHPIWWEKGVQRLTVSVTNATQGETGRPAKDTPEVYAALAKASLFNSSITINGATIGQPLSTGPSISLNDLIQPGTYGWTAPPVGAPADMAGPGQVVCEVVRIGGVICQTIRRLGREWSSAEFERRGYGDGATWDAWQIKRAVPVVTTSSNMAMPRPASPKEWEVVFDSTLNPPRLIVWNPSAKRWQDAMTGAAA